MRRSSLRKSGLVKKRRQVAAVCYRVQESGIEFLLVQTRDGRWIFPKGGVEPGLTHAQSAALEAVEEAGVHGRIEELPFARYFRCKPDPATPQPPSDEMSVTAHLCEVSRLERPLESNRKPTWFSAEKAKQRLTKDRAPAFGAELACVVDRALSRIQRLHGIRSTPDRTRRDGLQKVRFEAFEDGRLSEDVKTALVREFLRRKVHEIGGAGGMRRPALRLGAGTNSADNVTAIDSGRSVSRAKTSSRKISP